MKSNKCFVIPAILLLCACVTQKSNLIVRDYVPANQVNVPNISELQSLAYNGNPVAQYELGKLYYNGLGVPKSHKNAMNWWLKSSNSGYANAQYSLGILYFEGVGIKNDFVEGCRWLGAAARQGMPQSINMYSFKCR